MQKSAVLTAKQVSEKTGATLRQLQVWDENGVIVAGRGKHPQNGRPDARLYEPSDVENIVRLLTLRANFKIRFSDLAKLEKPGVPTMIITGPTLIGGTLVIPKSRHERAGAVA